MRPHVSVLFRPARQVEKAHAFNIEAVEKEAKKKRMEAAAKAREEKEAFFEFAKGMRERSRPSDLDPTDLIREDRDR